MHVTCIVIWLWGNLGPISISNMTSYWWISWSLEAMIGSLNPHIPLKFDRCISSSAADSKVPVIFQSDQTILNTNFMVSRLDQRSYNKTSDRIETGSRMAAFGKINMCPTGKNTCPTKQDQVYMPSDNIYIPPKNQFKSYVNAWI